MVNTSDRQTQLEQAIQIALTNARSLTASQGINAPETVIAWDNVEQLLAEKSYLQHHPQHPETPFEAYCRTHPERAECLVYDV
jgi:hypothetical protein